MLSLVMFGGELIISIMDHYSHIWPSLGRTLLLGLGVLTNLVEKERMRQIYLYHIKLVHLLSLYTTIGLTMTL
ncbi:hypothetical protein SDC9_199270 [bioreactor metagenome]|uniref:Uncharacterized protein n=1 Tax=bioreactor metagenome TaxID=1076179 RepID=A0A645ILA4_9ZZZZ